MDIVGFEKMPMMNEKQETYIWWQKTIIYQVYPRSFKDTTGDGIGDLQGIRGKLPYLKWLGVGAIWISPIYPSPMADFGYDISDYTAIHPLFGSMDDFDQLISETHKQGLKLILDLVPNHTSEEHPWFLESRSSRENPKRDWYIWRDPLPDGSPPNNWLSVFGGLGWEWDEHTGQYYYHAYLKQQPDLNWRNPEVQKEMWKIMRFWLDKGVDGFRVDVMWHMIKDDQFRDNPINPDYKIGDSPYRQHLPTFSTDQAEVHEVVAKMRKIMDEYGERVIIGEIYLPIEKLITYYGEQNSGAHLPFNFQLIVLDWDARIISAAIDSYEGSLPANGWPNWVLGNHDKPRIASRVGTAQAKVAAILLLTLRGTPTLYYGDEIAMRDVIIPPEMVQDPTEKNVPGLGRDPVRTPMQWNSSVNAGFTSGDPWLPIAGDYKEVNVEAESENRSSILTLYRRLIILRQKEAALHIGRYLPVNAEGNVIAYIREAEDTQFLIALNLGHKSAILSPPHEQLSGTIILSTHTQNENRKIKRAIKLEADEGMIVQLD